MNRTAPPLKKCASAKTMTFWSGGWTEFTLKGLWWQSAVRGPYTGFLCPTLLQKGEPQINIMSQYIFTKIILIIRGTYDRHQKLGRDRKWWCEQWSLSLWPTDSLAAQFKSEISIYTQPRAKCWMFALFVGGPLHMNQYNVCIFCIK